jgi:Peptidase family M23
VDSCPTNTRRSSRPSTEGPQTYAVDLIHVPSSEWKLEIGWSPLSRPATDYVSFGQPVVAPADATVVRTYDRARDHRSRTSWRGLLYLIPESAVRELTGSRRILGNHVVLDLGDGKYAAVAHLRQGSVRVHAGQRVSAGDPAGRVRQLRQLD